MVDVIWFYEGLGLGGIFDEVLNLEFRYFYVVRIVGLLIMFGV